MLLFLLDHGETIKQQVAHWLRANKDMPEFNKTTFSIEGKVFVPGIKDSFDFFKSIFGDSLNKVVDWSINDGALTIKCIA